MRSKLILVLAALMVVNTPISGQQRVGVIMGLGTTTCAQFGEFFRRDPGTEDSFFDWAQGFMSGINWQLNTNTSTRHLQRNLNSMDIITQRFFIRQYCDQRPLQSYFSAVYELYNRLPIIP